MKRILFLAPASAISVYAKSKIKIAISHLPVISLAVLAAPLQARGHEVRILDLSLYYNYKNKLIEVLEEFQPHFVGLTFTTPLYGDMKHLSSIVKQTNKDIKIIGGGPHATTLPEECLRDSDLDIIVIGEGDNIIADIVERDNLSNINGIAFKHSDKIIINPRLDYIRDLDKLPFPAWDLYDIKKYSVPKIRSKRNPVCSIETSRGCVYKCSFCNKSIDGLTFRPKSAEKVVDEIEHMLSLGIREVHTQDDGFSTDIKRAKKIFDLIIKRKIDVTINIANGIRVDRMDRELLEKAKKAGVYSTGFGIESGSQEILNMIPKSTNLEQIRKSVKLCKDVGIESVGYFMFGLDGETEKTMNETIDFAKSLDLNMAKATITVPFPGTPLFDNWDKKGYIKTKDWTKYNYHDPESESVYEHPNLSRETLVEYYNKFHKEFYLRPGYIADRLMIGIKTGSIFEDIKAAAKINW